MLLSPVQVGVQGLDQFLAWNLASCIEDPIQFCDGLSNWLAVVRPTAQQRHQDVLARLDRDRELGRPAGCQ